MCPTPAFTQVRSLFGELNMALLIESYAWQLVPYQLQNFLELIDVLRLGWKWLVAFKHSSPDMVVQRVEVRRIRRPFIFTNKFTAVDSVMISIMSYPQICLCPNPSILCVITIKETNSKAEQGNDNLIACDGNDDLTATENYSTMSVTIYDATQQRLPQQQQQLRFRDSRG